ncbi:MAG: hypothetical protein A3F84_06350 [Candidatus Handelsmanbacteria bacterium RIFCSPLOWO2_12_FULL_64_10]|uniref:Uncharacterized protein n=1 Tax=Handelsmanbacteria sp. (strain RIFCSPLOWO2_12_FULL_64_10) TaxID=1817868 RepID=A0A1F6C8E1_HANXR|nr:MAG: hypothetical protein A3F84_06350 [Candidatus Handelsmanbacteria bacterium RIFCSPLOWO2_12_FULL_64_10]
MARTPRPSLRRAVALGILFSVAINAFDPISRYVVHSSTFTSEHLPFALLFCLLTLTFGANPVLRRLRPGSAFSAQELAAVVAICFLGTSIPTMAGRFLAVISAPDYFASPENEWPDYVLPNLPRWLIPSNEGGGIGHFYQGLPPGEPLPWAIWLQPLFWWFGLIVAILFGCFCLSVVLRRQWSDRERLAFPLVEAPLLFAREPEAGRMLPAFVGDRLFWAGYAIPAAMILWNVVGHFRPGTPTFGFLNNNNLLPLGRGFPDLYLRFDFYVICFAFFTHLDILFSMWFFHFLAALQIGLSHRLGLGPQTFDAGVSWQINFGLVFFVLWGIYMARRQIGAVCRKALRGDPEVDDSDELLSYRTAFWGCVLSAVYIFVWMCRAGMSPLVASVYFFFSFILYLGMAKIVAQSGLVSLRGSGGGWPTKSLVNIKYMDDTSIAATDLMLALYAYAKGFCMPSASNAARASEAVRGEKRGLGRAILIGAVLSLFACVLMTLALGYYGPGAENFGSYDYTNGNRHGYTYTTSDIKGRGGARWPWLEIGYGIAGALITALLTFLNYRLPWWPLHPIGFTVSFQYPTRASFFSVFVAWLLKVIVMRVGGIGLYRRGQVFFLGVLLGYATAVVLSFVLDCLFFMGQGHAVHTPPI